MCIRNKKTAIALIILLLVLTLNIHISYSQTWQNMNGPWLANVSDMTIGRASSASNATLYVTVGTNIYRSMDGSGSWNVCSSIGGTPLTITCKQSDPTYLLAGRESYFKKSIDGGNSWTNIYSNDPVLHPLSSAISAPNPDYMFFGIQKVNGQSSMRRTSDGGLTWFTVNYFFGGVMTDVKAVTPHPQFQTLVWAGGSTPVGYNKQGETYIYPYTNGVFYSTNAGADWSNTGNLSKNVVALAAYTRSATDYLFAASDDPFFPLYKTTSTQSESAVWSMVSFSGGLISDLKVDQNNNLYAAAVNGMYKSTNDGVTWIQINNGLYDINNINSVAIDPVNASNVFAGSGTTIFKSTDGGLNWSDAATGITKMPVSAVGACAGINLALSPTYSVVERNSGTGWANAGHNVTDFLGKMVGFKNSTGSVAFAAGYRLGYGASLWRSTNYGNSPWYEIRNGTDLTGIFNGIIIDPVNADRIYAFGKVDVEGNIDVTLNGGDSWERLELPGEVSNMVVDATNAQPTYSTKMFASVCIGSSSRLGIWKTTNGGATWVRLSHSLVLGQPVCALALHPYNPSCLYAAGGSTGSWWLRKSIDGGTTWSTITGITTEVTRMIMPPSYTNSASHLWVVADGGNKIFKTKDGGSNWAEVNTDALPKPIYDIRKDIGNDSIMNVATASGVYKINPSPEPPINLVGSIENNHPKITWDANIETDLKQTGTYEIYRYFRPCTYVGPQWNCGTAGPAQKIATTSNTYYVDISQNIWSGPPSPDILVRKAGYYVKAVDNCNYVSGNSNSAEFLVGKITQIEKATTNDNDKLPDNFELGNNYPNPFNPTTQIQYSLPENVFVNLKVFDMLGRQVAVLVNDYQEAGYKSVGFEATDLPSGIYLYEINAGKFHQVKKMLVIK